MADAKAENSGGSSSEGGGPGKLVLVLTLVNLIACIGMGAILFISFKNEKTQPQVTDIQAGGEHAAKEADGHGAAKPDGHGAAAGHGAGKEAAKKPSEYGKMIQLEMFSVNLSTPGGTQQKFVRVNISVEVPTEEVETEVNSKMPQVRNAIIDLFNSKRPNDLATSEGREFLKEEIRGALNSFMTSGKVKGVYFTNFVVTS